MSFDNIQVREGWLQLSGMDDGSTLTGLGLGTRSGIASGTESGAFYSAVIPRSGAATTVTNGATISHNGAGRCRLTNGGAVTGVIVQAGTFDGQELVLINTAANTITMAAAGTSNVANGTGCIISATAAITLTWNANDLRWYQTRAA